MSRRWYHASPHDLAPGALLVPGGGASLNVDLYRAHPDNARLADYVWITDSCKHALDWWDAMTEQYPTLGGWVYRVQPHTVPVRPDEEYPQDNEWTTDRATVLGKWFVINWGGGRRNASLYGAVARI